MLLIKRCSSSHITEQVFNPADFYRSISEKLHIIKCKIPSIARNRAFIICKENNKGEQKNQFMKKINPVTFSKNAGISLCQS